MSLNRIAIVISSLALSACAITHNGGPYIRSIELAPDGRVQSYERCDMVFTYDNANHSNSAVAPENCQRVGPRTKAANAPPPDADSTPSVK